MPYEIGDIVIKNDKWPGHVLMCVTAKNGRNSEKFIHATWNCNFSIDDQVENKDGVMAYLINDVDVHFSPSVPFSAVRKAEIVNVAERIASTTKYGLYRATRLLFGSKTFGSGARSRLNKYHSRLKSGIGHVVATVTCSEAVLLCHQLTSKENELSFINLDAAHTMPRDLLEYLNSNVHWIRK